jgi:hypothetical protein
MYCPPSGRSPSLRRRFFTWLSIVRSNASNDSPKTASPELLAGEHHARMRRERGDQVELHAGELQGRARPERLPRARIHDEVEEDPPVVCRGRCEPRGRSGGNRAAEHRAHPGDQLARLEGLGHVVVRADLQAGHPVHELIPRGEEDHRRSRTAGAKLPEDVEAGAAREHHVKHDEVGVVREDGGERRLAVAGRGHLVSLAHEVRPHHLQDVRLVVDDEDACHGREHTRGPGQSGPALRHDLWIRDYPARPDPSQAPLPAPPAPPPPRMPAPLPRFPLPRFPLPSCWPLPPCGPPPAPTAAPRMPPMVVL